MNFVALDFETANECRDSACALGLTTVADGRIVETIHHLIRPPELRFGFWNTKCHGLSEVDVIDAPTFGDLWPSIRGLIEGHLIVAHNAAFDTSVLRHSLKTARIEMPRVEYLCSLSIARHAWPRLASYNLGFLAATFGLDLTHHHAGSDAAAAAHLLLLAAKQQQANCPYRLATSLGVYTGEIFSHDDWISCYSPRAARDNQVLEVALPTGYDVSQHPFYEKTIEFTGKLSLFGRSEAERVVSMFGGYSNGSGAKKTQILVIGALDVRTLAAGKSESGKIEKARGLKEKGCDIQIITDADFAEMIFFPVAVKTDG